MTLSIRLGDFSFCLDVESDKISAGSSVNVEYLSENENSHPDTIVHLSNFTGKLKIQNVKFIDNSDKDLNGKCDDAGSCDVDRSVKIPQSNEKKDKATESLNAPLTNESDEKETELHKLCSEPSVHVKDLQEYFKSHNDLASVRDGQGRLPLHIFANNKSAVISNNHKDLHRFINHLIDEHSLSAGSVDENGTIPFMAAIVDWVNECNSISNDIQIRSNYGYSFLHRADLSAPVDVKMDYHVQWSFEMLSIILYKVIHPASRCRHSLCTLDHDIIEKISSIPLLVKTILYIDDEVFRSDVIYQPIIQHCLLQRGTAGGWIVGMLANGGADASRAIDYFEFLSTASIIDSIDPRKFAHDREMSHKMKEDVIECIATLDGIFPSLLALNQKERTRALSTFVLHRILDRSVLNIALVSAIFLELFFDVLLVMTLNVQFAAKLQHTDKVNTPAILILWICSYFIIFEEICIFNKSFTWNDVFKQYLSFGRLIDLFAIFGSAGAVISLKLNTHKKVTMHILYAILFLLVWLRLFRFLKKVNKDLATFMHILGVIIKESFWLLIILFTLCLIFSDITYILLSSNMNNLCAGVDESQKDSIGDLCSIKNSRRFLRAYASLVGDLSIDDYRGHWALSTLWVLFTFIGVIVLLNVLIGVVNNVYSSSSLLQDSLIGNVWLPMLGKNEALSKSLQKLFTRDEHNYVKFHVKKISLIVIFLTYIAIMYYGFYDAFKAMMAENITLTYRLEPFMLLFITCMMGVSVALIARLHSIFKFSVLSMCLRNIKERRRVEKLITYGAKILSFFLGIRMCEEEPLDNSLIHTKYLSSRIELLRQDIKEL